MSDYAEKAPKTPDPDKPRNTPETAIGKVVQYYRTQLDISQEELSKACGLGRNAINEIEGGKRKKLQRGTVTKIIGGLNALDLEVSIEEFDGRVADLESFDYPTDLVQSKIAYTDTPYKEDITQGKQDLAYIINLIPSAREVVAEIAKRNDEMRFARGVGNILNRIEKIANGSGELDIEAFSRLMHQFDGFCQEANQRNLNQYGDLTSLKDLRGKLSGFEDELSKIYTKVTDGLIPNGWPIEDVKHLSLIDELFAEIESRKHYLEDTTDIELKSKAIDILEELEIELDRNPLHLKNIDEIRARLEEFDRDIFKELLITSQLLLGTYAEHLPPGSVFRDHRVAPEMVVIPPGEFMMGSAKGKLFEGDKYESPQHKVTIANKFSVGRYPVTFEEWDFYTEKNVTAHKPDDEGWGRDRRPVINISWHDASGYLGWLKTQTSYEYSLLSESQWEYVCRAGTDTEYYFGDDESQLDEYGWFSDNSDNKTQTVGLKKPNKFGLYDMHGNVEEWCQDDWHYGYKDGSDDGSAWMSTSSSDSDYITGRFTRGGAWCLEPVSLSSGFRGRDNFPDRRIDLIGFRVARAL